MIPTMVNDAHAQLWLMKMGERAIPRGDEGFINLVRCAYLILGASRDAKEFDRLMRRGWNKQEAVDKLIAEALN